MIVPRDCVGKPMKFRGAKGVTNGGVAVWYWHIDEFSDGVEGNVVHAKAPDKVVYVSDIFLMRLRSKQRLGEPGTVMNLFYVTQLNELSNSFLHNWLLSWSKGWVFAGNRPGITSVNFTFVVLYRKCDTLFAEDTPVLLDNISKLKLASRCEVSNIKVFMKHATMYRLIVFDAKVWINVSQGRHRVKAFLHKASSLHL